jgi:hypothetical protein
MTDISDYLDLLGEELKLRLKEAGLKAGDYIGREVRLM